MGRMSHSSFHQIPEIVSASDVPVIGPHKIAGIDGNKYDYEVPHPLKEDEIPAVVESFRYSASLAKEADFDGVEVHGAYGK